MEESLLFLSPRDNYEPQLDAILPVSVVQKWGMSVIQASLMMSELALPGPLLLDIAYLQQPDYNELHKQASNQNLPIAYVDTDYNSERHLQCHNSGAQDYFAPPTDPQIIHQRLLNLYRLHQTSCNLGHQHARLSEAQEEFQLEMAMVQDAAILCLAAMARMRDHSTGNHILRTQHYVKELAEYLRFHPKFRDELDDPYSIQLLYKSAALHDIGKVGVHDQILQKPGSLSPDEYEAIKKHTLYGFQALQTAESLLEKKDGKYSRRFLEIGKQVTLSHHERWDGTGYPQGLKEEEIPAVARLMAVADVYDAMTSNRPYKNECKHETAATMIIEGRGTHFDPIVVDAFIALKNRFEQIALKLQDQFPSLSSPAMDSEVAALNQ